VRLLTALGGRGEIGLRTSAISRVRRMVQLKDRERLIFSSLASTDQDKTTLIQRMASCSPGSVEHGPSRFLLVGIPFVRYRG